MVGGDMSDFFLKPLAGLSCIIHPLSLPAGPLRKEKMDTMSRQRSMRQVAGNYGARYYGRSPTISRCWWC